MRKLLKCDKCGDTFPESEITTDRYNKLVCDICVQVAIERAITIKVYRPESVSEFIWTDVLGFQDKKSLKRLFKIPAIYKYTEVDQSWIPELYPEYVSVLFGAKISYMDPKARQLVEFMKKLNNRTITPPSEIVINMIPIDGVVMSIDLIVQRNVAGDMEGWMRRLN
jgi:hypothetical protein